MAKNYSKKTLITKKLKPEEEIISFLLGYSKALKMVRIKSQNFEIMTN